MKFRVLVVLVVAFSMLAIVACKRDAERSLCRNNFARCAEWVNNCPSSLPSNTRYVLFRKTFDGIAAITNAELKIVMAKEFSSLVPNVDLKLHDDDYIEFADRVSRFKTLLDWTTGALFDAKVEGEYILRHITDGMTRYHDACYSIPIAPMASNETVAAYAKKCQAVSRLASDYEYAMMLFEKLEKGNLRRLPSELHGRYHEWKKTIAQYPKAKEVLEKLHSISRTGRDEQARGVRCQ